jgi:hypothetical protein
VGRTLPSGHDAIEGFGVRAWSQVERIATIVALLAGREVVSREDLAEAVYLHGDHW